MTEGNSTFYIVRPFEATLANMTSNLEYIAPINWDSSDPYTIGYLVNYNGLIYRGKVLSSNVNHQPDTNPAYWDVVSTGTQMYAAGTAYAIGDRVFVQNSFVIDVYESLTVANTGHTPASSPTYWVLRQTIYREWAPAIPLAIDRIVTWNKNLYKHLVTGSDPVTPDLAPDKWQYIGPADVWAPFDDKTGTQATRADLLTYTFTVTGRMDTIAFINIAADNVNIKVNGGADYDQDFNLVATEEIYDWYTYFLEEPTTADRLYVGDLPAVLDPTITITFTGAQVKAGLIVLGRAREVGETKAGAGIGIQDFSIKQQDGFGGYYIVPRGFNDQGDFSVVVPNAWVDGLRRVLSDIRATPTLFIGTEDYTSTYYYGICTWNISFDFYQQAILKIEITGL